VRGTRRRTGGAGLAVLAAAVLWAGAGCQDSRALTGTFRSTTAVVLADVPGLEGGVWVELVLGHFGPDVAGIVRFFADDAFILPVPGACRCRYLVDGRFESRQVVFAFPSPSPCEADPGVLLAARLDVSTDWDTLEGPLGRELEGAPRWAFRRNLDASDLGDQEKKCTETAEEPLPAQDVLDAVDGAGGER
jgi:hypothetical protein